MESWMFFLIYPAKLNMQILQKLHIFIFGYFICNANADTLEMKFWKKNDDTLIAYGMISEQSLVEFKKQDFQKIKYLVVTSGGGEIHAAAEIGLIILRNNITVIASEYCLSSCANWLFLPAKEKILSKNALLGFHADIISQFNLVRKQIKISNGDPSKNLFLIGEESTKLLFSEAGISSTIYSEIAQRTTYAPPSIVMSVKTDKGQLVEYELTGNDENDSTLYSKYQNAKVISYRWKGRIENAFWFPSKSELESFKVSGIQDYYYPTNIGEVESLEKGYRIHLIGSWKQAD
ncbi:hypothetical protein ACO0KY_19560 [Undibacterium sp. Dicai25W]|uniref:hypothetical protein n=1 Tax=Undibacterium sp. Dicai25W TaxID=3413034 RepID=UPI003BF333D2